MKDSFCELQMFLHVVFSPLSQPSCCAAGNTAAPGRAPARRNNSLPCVCSIFTKQGSHSQHLLWQSCQLQEGLCPRKRPCPVAGLCSCPSQAGGWILWIHEVEKSAGNGLATLPWGH